MLSDSNSDQTADQTAQQCLRDIRPLLLNLHKALLEQERTNYEQTYGPIATTGEYFQLVLDHEWFNWLRPISQMIVRIDERLSTKKPEVAESAEGLLREVRGMLNPLEDGSITEQRYYHAVQQNPTIAMMHEQFVLILVKA